VDKESTAKKLTLSDLGEFAVIDRLLAGRPSRALVGPGDDAAVVTAPDGRMVVSTDMLVEHRHFRLDWSTPRDVGRKAIAQNAADIEAMGATVTGFLVAFGAPAQTPVTMVDDLADGMWEEAGRAGGAEIVGGDLVSSPQWVLGITAFGDLAGRPPVTLSGARAGATLAVCGRLGHSAAGYALWEGDSEGLGELRGAHLVPEPPYGQGAAAARAGAIAMTDVSDGLVADLRHIADASGVGIDVSTAALATDLEALAEAADVLDTDGWAWVLAGGEDHALVAVFDGRVPEGWRAIGTVVDGPPRVLVDRTEWNGAAGWQSFD
jgi:thiamine-monophosphate kinase